MIFYLCKQYFLFILNLAEKVVQIGWCFILFSSSTSIKICDRRSFDFYIKINLLLTFTYIYRVHIDCYKRVSYITLNNNKKTLLNFCEVHTNCLSETRNTKIIQKYLWIYDLYIWFVYVIFECAKIHFFLHRMQTTIQNRKCSSYYIILLAHVNNNTNNTKKVW